MRDVVQEGARAGEGTAKFLRRAVKLLSSVLDSRTASRQLRTYRVLLLLSVRLGRFTGRSSEYSLLLLALQGRLLLFR